MSRGTYTTDDILILPAGAGQKLNTAPVITSHPSPDELRAGFRRLLASCGPKLLQGEIIEVQCPGSIGVASLSIVPQLTARDPGAAGTLQRDITLRAFSRLVLRDLEAIFSELVVRDRQFQQTPKFAANAAQQDFPGQLPALLSRHRFGPTPGPVDDARSQFRPDRDDAVRRELHGQRW
jgi:hypothetical protein